jgi:hypothetical protein
VSEQVRPKIAVSEQVLKYFILIKTKCETRVTIQSLKFLFVCLFVLLLFSIVRIKLFIHLFSKSHHKHCPQTILKSRLNKIYINVYSKVTAKFAPSNVQSCFIISVKKQPCLPLLLKANSLLLSCLIYNENKVEDKDTYTIKSLLFLFDIHNNVNTR